jgi:hypothetical protein
MIIWIILTGIIAFGVGVLVGGWACFWTLYYLGDRMIPTDMI